MRSTLTALPEIPHSFDGNSGTYKAAQLSLCLLLVAHASGCLITDVPENEDITRTRPQLLNPNPRTTEFLLIVAANNVSTPQTFAAEVLSEDGGDDLEAAFLIDYGVETSGNPWREDEYLPTIEAGTLAMGPRPFTKTWRVQPSTIDTKPEDPTTAGCHTVTLLVTHAIRNTPDAQLCPADLNDYDTLTWFVSVCNAAASCTFDDCPTAGADFRYCDSAEEVMQ